MSITATVENGTIKLPPDVHWPDGTRVRVEAVKRAEQKRPGEAETKDEKPRSTLAERYAPFIGIVTDAPEDLAENHDHYIHGTPKRKP